MFSETKHVRYQNINGNESIAQKAVNFVKEAWNRVPALNVNALNYNVAA